MMVIVIPSGFFYTVGTKIDKRQDIKVQGTKRSLQYEKVTGTKVVSEQDGRKAASQINATSYLECSALTAEVY